MMFAAIAVIATMALLASSAFVVATMKSEERRRHGLAPKKRESKS